MLSLFTNSFASSKFFGTCNVSSAVDMFVLALCYQMYGSIKEDKHTVPFHSEHYC